MLVRVWFTLVSGFVVETDLFEENRWFETVRIGDWLSVGRIGDGTAMFLTAEVACLLTRERHRLDGFV